MASRNIDLPEKVWLGGVATQSCIAVLPETGRLSGLEMLRPVLKEKFMITHSFMVYLVSVPDMHRQRFLCL